MKKIYLSRKKYKEIKKELAWRKTIYSQEIAERLAKSREFGDLSENAAYQEAKEAKMANDRKIFELENLLANAEIIKERSREKVELGSLVELLGEKGKVRYRLLGSYDASPKFNFISDESPLGRALLGRKVGEEIEIEVNGKKFFYKILKIN